MSRFYFIRPGREALLTCRDRSLGNGAAGAALKRGLIKFRIVPMRKSIVSVALLLAATALSACGHTTEQRAATGAIAGAVVAGPVGAVVGGAAGAARPD